MSRGHQLGAIRLRRIPHLGHLDDDLPFRSADPSWLVPIAIAAMFLLWPAALVVITIDEYTFFLAI
jgi:hypothetical protein